MSSIILLTVDVEDWFQVENFKQCIPFSSWDKCELRVETNTHRILDLLDSQQSVVSDQQSAHSKADPRFLTPDRRAPIKATFFILGWLAKRLPHLVREIHSRGHEVASHGYYHNLCNQESLSVLKKDLSDSKKLIEDIIAAPVFGYRAPSFCVSHSVLKTIEDCGYLYDSSYNSFNMHSRYGYLDLSQNGRKGIAFQISNAFNGLNERSDRTNLKPSAATQLRSFSSARKSCRSHELSAVSYDMPLSSSPSPEPRAQFYELPISNLQVGNHALPWGGGAYLRIIPFPLFKLGVQSILKKDGAYIFYMHPWEIDQEQPRVDEASMFLKFRHYINLNKTVSKLSMFLEAFNQCRFITCREYLEELRIGRGDVGRLSYNVCSRLEVGGKRRSSSDPRGN